MLSLVECIATDDIPINWLNPTRILPIIIPKPINSFAGDQIEPPRDCRRLKYLRGYSHGQGNQVFTRGPGTGGYPRWRAAK